MGMKLYLILSLGCTHIQWYSGNPQYYSNSTFCFWCAWVLDSDRWMLSSGNKWLVHSIFDAIFYWFLMLVHRKRFFKFENDVQTIDAHNVDPSAFVKSMCRLQNSLCSVMDDINVCYSIQVCKSIQSIYANNYMQRFSQPTDYVEFRAILIVLSFGVLHDLSGHYTPKWTDTPIISYQFLGFLFLCFLFCTGNKNGQHSYDWGKLELYWTKIVKYNLVFFFREERHQQLLIKSWIGMKMKDRKNA